MDANAQDLTDEEISINVAASFTADSLEAPLRFWMEEFHQRARIQFAPHGQLFQQLITDDRPASDGQHDIRVGLLRLEDWGGAAANGAVDSFAAEIERNVGDFLRHLRNAAERAPATFILCLCPPSRERLADGAVHAAITRMEDYLVSAAGKIGGVHVVHYDDVLRLYPIAEIYDEFTDKLAHIPYTAVFFTGVGTTIARKIYALRRTPRKVIVLDCDDTLWGGVCAEEGPTGVNIDGPRQALQQFLLKQRAAGLLLCLCSKNNEEDVQAVFDSHPGMVLRRDHFLASRINWGPKSVNLRSLADELNLGVDSFILIDDDPVECGEVRANCPEVLTIQLPRDTQRIAKFLDHLWVFDSGKLTAEDQRRTELYRENFERDSVRKRALTFAEFLAELRLEIVLSPATPGSLERICDLTYRTNQFNLSTIRRSEPELRNLAREGKEILAVNVRDRFGDYGLVGVIIFRLAGSLMVDTFLLSCRAMGRGVEHQMLARLGAIARDRQADKVELRFVPTAKNKPIADFLESLVNAQKIADAGAWRYQIPASSAADCKMDPNRVGHPSGEGGEAVAANTAFRQESPGRSTPGGIDDVLIRIATQLNDAKAIHEVISSYDHTRPELAVPFVAPGSPIEKEIADIWSELLGFESIGVNDNFFELGGHSLLAMQVLSRIRENFDIELSPRLLVTQELTVATLAKAILMEQIRQSDTAEIEAMLENLDDVSADELRKLIGAEGGK